MPGTASADWLDKLKETAKDLTDKAGEALENAEPTAPSTSDGEGQVKKPATTAAPAKPAAPEPKAVAAPAAPAQPAVSGNNDKTLVRETQKELKRLGYSIAVDGAYGPNTKKQIIAFEQSQNLAASGNASAELLATLKATPTPQAATTTAATAVAPATTPEEEKTAEKKAEEPKAAQTKAEPKKSEPAPAAIPDILEAVIVNDDPNGEAGWIMISAPENAEATVAEIYFGENKYRHKFTYFSSNITNKEIPFEAHITTQNGSYNYIGRCYKYTDCWGEPSPKVSVQTYKDFIDLINTAGIFEFQIVTSDPAANRFGDKTYKVHMPTPEKQAAANKAQQEEVDKIAAEKKIEAEKIATAKQAEADKIAAEQVVIAAAKKVEEDQNKAIMAELSPEGKIAFARCIRNEYAKKYYSCSCLGNEIDQYVDSTIAKRVKRLTQLNSGFENAIQKNNANPKLSAERKAELEKNMRKKIEEQKQELEIIQNKPSWNATMRQEAVVSAETYLHKATTCKIADSVRVENYNYCQKYKMPDYVKGKTKAEYCTCVSDKAAEYWVTSSRGFDSGVATSARTVGLHACRK
ncbi:hypothetical protein GQF03_03735 [Sneathiella chungangensis]|uniref:Peptidoglycan binding-like domain-containing protein n=1 Tax=Sneathiella chungangensis TaxID=1418234 RepID=A0A845MCJ8_9PROT|nr:peptidoglycan-binding domain-containing protein [Sneathiella chungangensis]MZR21435.1 hypothetical protein [Sneathiella chungangensis]